MFATTEDTLKNLSQVLHGASTAFQRQLVTAEVKEKLSLYISSLMTLFCIRHYLTVMWDCLIVGTFQDPLCTEHRVWHRHRIGVWGKIMFSLLYEKQWGHLHTHPLGSEIMFSPGKWVYLPSRCIYLPRERQ